MTSLASIKKMYKQLPYIAFKYYKNYYLLPHKPSRPSPKHMQIFNEANYEKKKLYDGNLTSKFKGFQSLINPNEDKITQLHKQHSKNFSQYQQKLRIYYQLYMKPLKIKGTCANKIFRKQTRENELKRLEITNKKQHISQFKTTKIDKVWQNMSQEQKKIYYEKQRVFKLDNLQLLTSFIQKHQIPFVKKCPPISIYGAKYLSDYLIQSGQKRITAQFMLKFKQLPKQQIQFFKKQASQIFQQRKLKYQKFLQRWNLNDQQLKKIVEVSDKYKKLDRQSRKQNYGSKFQDESEDQQLDKLEVE